MTSSCAIYCHYSSETQRDWLSIEAQQRACTDFASKQGWTVSKVYVDEATSGTSDDQPSFRGTSTDIIEASAKAYIAAVNKLVSSSTRRSYLTRRAALHP